MAGASVPRSSPRLLLYKQAENNIYAGISDNFSLGDVAHCALASKQALDIRSLVLCLCNALCCIHIPAGSMEDLQEACKTEQRPHGVGHTSHIPCRQSITGKPGMLTCITEVMSKQIQWQYILGQTQACLGLPRWKRKGVSAWSPKSKQLIAKSYPA